MCERFLALPEFARRNSAEWAQTSEYYDLTLDVEPPGSGRIRWTAAQVDEERTGVYIQGVPVSLTAVRNPGWQFEK